MHQARESSTGHSPPRMAPSFAASAAPARLHRRNLPSAESATSPFETRYSFAASPLQNVDSRASARTKTRLQHLIRSRYYDPKAGRFVASDQLMRTPSYTYVDNNSPRFADPYGLIKQENVKCYSCDVHGGAANGAVRGVCRNVFQNPTCQTAIRKWEKKYPGLEQCLRNHCDADGKMNVVCMRDCRGTRCGGPAGKAVMPDTIYVCSPGVFNGFCDPKVWGHEMAHMCGIGGDLGGGGSGGGGMNQTAADEIGDACKPK